MTEAIIAGVFGLLIGSFLNVCIHRWPRGRSVVRPRSHCVRCRKVISWYDNIPVVSYILLGGKCRYCKRHISLRYPVVELLNGALWFWFVHLFGVSMAGAKMCVFSSILLSLTFSDLEKRLLPDQLTKGGMVIGFVFSLFVTMPGILTWVLHQFLGLSGPLPSLAESLVGAAFPALLLWGGAKLWSAIRGRESWEMLGMGDVKLVAMVGSFVGLMDAMTTMLYGAIGGSIIGTVYVLAAKKKFSQYELPFGTFLAVAGLVVAVMMRP